MLEKTKLLEQKVNSLGHAYVPGVGPFTARLWIIGEAPGEEEEKSRIPFVGKAGGFLNGLLRAADIKRDVCFISNISPVRPPANEWKKLEETGVTKEECVEALQEQIAFFKPNCVLALGDHAMEAVTGKTGITEWRGYIQQNAHCKTVASFHPAYILRMGEKTAKKEREGKGGVKYSYGTARTTLLLDMLRAKRESESKVLELPERNLLWDTDQKEALEWIRLMEGEPEAAFDIETKGTWIDRIALAGVAGSMSVPLDTGEFKYDIREHLAGLLGKHKGLVAQNGGFDMGQLGKAGLTVGRLYADTMIAHHLLYPEFPHALDYLASIYCRLSEPPHVKGWDEAEKRGKANALHAQLTLEIWKKLEQELKEVA